MEIRYERGDRRRAMDAGALAGASFGMLAAAGAVAFALRRKLTK